MLLNCFDISISKFIDHLKIFLWDELWLKNIFLRLQRLGTRFRVLNEDFCLLLRGRMRLYTAFYHYSFTNSVCFCFCLGRRGVPQGPCICWRIRALKQVCQLVLGPISYSTQEAIKNHIYHASWQYLLIIPSRPLFLPTARSRRLANRPLPWG